MARTLMALLRPAPGAILLLQLLTAVQGQNPLDPFLSGGTTGSTPDVTTVSASDVTTVSAPDVTTVSAPDVTTVSAAAVTTVNAPDVTTASAPDATTVSASDVTTVSAPDVTTISAPDVTTISAPDVTTISAPDVTTISAPDTTTVVAISVPGSAADTTTAATDDDTTTAASSETTTDGQILWVALLFRIRVDMPYEDWMADENSSSYQQLASDAKTAATSALEDEFGDDHVITEVIRITTFNQQTRIIFNTTVKTTATRESDIPLKNIEFQLKTAMNNIQSVADNSVRGSMYEDEYEVIAPFTIPQTAETTVREKRSTTAAKDPTTGPGTPATTVSTTGGGTTGAPATDRRPTTAATSGGATSGTTAAAASTATVAASTATEAANATTEAANATTEAANATTEAANATTEAANTTSAPTTTEAPPPLSAKLSCEITINMEYVNWMAVSFTPQYAQLKNKIEELANYVLTDKFGDNLQEVEVKSFQEGVVVALDVTVQTDKTRAEDVDAKTLAKETTAALQQLIDEDGFTFDPAAAQTSEEIVIIEPTTSPPPTEYPYRFTIMRFAARAPFANYSEALNDTESEGFADMEGQIQEGAELMLSKKFPKSSWNVSTSILWMSNATEEVENAPEQLGVTINFLIKVEPQMTNTSEIVRNLAKSFVHFNKLGNLQIAPDSLKFKDLTNYAPGKGVVIMDEDYLRELRKTRYNGSYVGDYTTALPTVRPVVKRHSGLVLGIAVPAFIGMIAAIGLMLICTTIAGAKKTDD